MVIAALSEDTVRLLGSPIVITTPVDLVKELLDNALDAKATSVEIIVAPNLVDRLEVRDNGHGICEEDFDCLGRPGHTSKIVSFDDIHNLGGTTLGFRGQALASANSLGTISVTTRTAKDPTAFLLQMRAGLGGVDNKQRVSAPIGTTVSVTGLYSNTPVRERITIKEAHKNIPRIKQLLQEYALARPGIRLSYKTLGGNGRWSYSPRPQATTREAVIQMFGTEVMSQCMIRTICSGQVEGETEATHDNDQMSLQAVLPSADGDLSKVSKGAFFAVDSRPLTAANGTMNKLLKIFKSHMARALSGCGGHECPRGLFISVNIRCSPGAYDPNIEPSKDQVLFARETQLINMFDRLCIEVYRTQQNSDAFVTLEKRRLLHGIQTQTPPLSSDGPEDGARPELQVISLEHHHEPHSHDSTLIISRRSDTDYISRSKNLSGSHSGSPGQLPTTSGTSLSQNVHAGIVPARSHITAASEQKNTKDCDFGETQNTEADLPNLGLGAGVAGTVAEAHDSLCHRFLYNVPGSNILRDLDMSSDEEAEILASRFRNQLDARTNFQDRENLVEPSNPRTRLRNVAPVSQGLGSDAASKGVMINTGHPQEAQYDPSPDGSFEHLPILRSYRSLAGHVSPVCDMRLRTIHTARQPQIHRPMAHGLLVPNEDADLARCDMQQAQLQSQFSGKHNPPNLRTDRQNTRGGKGPDGLVQATISFGEPKLPSQESGPQRAQLHVDDVLSRSNLPYRKPWTRNNAKSGSTASQNSQSTLDYSRKQADISPVDNMGCNDSRYQHHEHAAHSKSHAPNRPEDPPIERLTTYLQSVADTGENVFETDSNKYFMSRQRSELDHKKRGRQLLKRVKSDMLPLERVPDTHQMQQLVLIMVPDVEKLGISRSNPTRDTAFCDDHLAETNLNENLSLDDAAEIKARLGRLLNDWVEITSGQRVEVELNIGALVKGKSAAT